MRLFWATTLVALGLLSACSGRTEDVLTVVEPPESEAQSEAERTASLATIPLIDQRPIRHRELFVPLIDAQSSERTAIPLIDSIEDARIRTAIRPIDEGLWEMRRSSRILPIDALAPPTRFTSITPIDGAVASLDVNTSIAPIDRHRWDAWARITPIDVTVRPELREVAIRPIDYHLAASTSASIEPIDYFLWSMAGDSRVLPIEYYLPPPSTASIPPIDEGVGRPPRHIQPIDVYIPRRSRRSEERPTIQPLPEPVPPTGLEPF